MAAGTFSKYFDSLTTRWTSYVLGNEASAAAEPGAGGLIGRYWADLPVSSILLAVYLVALLLLAVRIPPIARRMKGVSPLLERPLPLLFVFYLLAAAAAVGMGQLYFHHYYLYMMPPVAALFGLAANLFIGASRESSAIRLCGLLFVILLVGSRLAEVGAAGVGALAADWTRQAFPLLYLLAGALLIGFIAWRPRRNVPAAVVMLLCLEAVGLVIGSLALTNPPSFPYHRDRLGALAARMELLRRPGDRLFVWGWLPELYSLTRLEPASHFSITQYVVNDYQAVQAEPELDDYFANQLMRDLERRPPRFIVDAWRRSWTMERNGDPARYRLDLYPQFGLRAFLAEHYERVGLFDGCELYVRE
jgi:hypothetical protein